uniref:Putative secreted protein n=1 Tax=Anopheles darlingi TaxID=43151 RepID=A0A2M4D8Q8_ANODA
MVAFTLTPPLLPLLLWPALVTLLLLLPLLLGQPLVPLELELGCCGFSFAGGTLGGPPGVIGWPDELPPPGVCGVCGVWGIWSFSDFSIALSGSSELTESLRCASGLPPWKSVTGVPGPALLPFPLLPLLPTLPMLPAPPTLPPLAGPGSCLMMGLPYVSYCGVRL